MKIPVHVDYVSEYGAQHSYLSSKGVQDFIAWRPEYRDAVFETPTGTYRQGAFSGDPKAFRMVTASEVGKMSKSKFNVINPDDVVAQYGADCFRMYEMFLGPVEQAKPWDTKGIDGVSRFLRRFWSLFFNKHGVFAVSEEAPSREELKILHQAIKRVQDDIERFSFNTCVSGFMISVNELLQKNSNKRDILDPMVRLLAPFAPFVAEELWHLLGYQGSVHHAPYPELNEGFLVEDMVEYPVSVNGKRRASVGFPAEAGQEAIQAAVLEMETIQKWLEGKQVQRVVVVPKRMINIVTTD